MSGMPLETCSAFNERWNNKFCYKVASCWLFLLTKIFLLVPTTQNSCWKWQQNAQILHPRPSSVSMQQMMSSTLWHAVLHICRVHRIEYCWAGCVISHYAEMLLWQCPVYAVHLASVQQRLGSWTLRSRTFLLWITHPFTEAICMIS